MKSAQPLKPGPQNTETHYYVPFFTGKYGDQQFWKGFAWLGPTNLVGHKPEVFFDPDSRRFKATTHARIETQPKLAFADIEIKLDGQTLENVESISYDASS